MSKFGLIFALNEEIDEILLNFEINKQYTIFGLDFYEINIYDKECVLVECGVGKVNAARCTQIMIDVINVDCIINIGVAGGITNILNPCDIVIGTRLVQHDFDITVFNHEKGYIPNVGIYMNSDDYLLKCADDCKNSVDCKIYSGVIASGDIFCTDIKMGKKINEKFDALCVDMEGASIAQVCYLAGMPFLVIRCISDILNNKNVITYEEFLKISSKNVADYLINIFKILN